MQTSVGVGAAEALTIVVHHPTLVDSVHGIAMSDSKLQRVGELDLAEDIAFERKSWIVQRVAWTIMTLILLAALLGAFGNGWLSRAQSSADEGALQLDYNRFIRFQAPAELTIRFSGPTITENYVGFWLNREYLKAIALSQITPAPREQIGTADGVIYIFDSVDAWDTLEVSVRGEVHSIGAIHGAVARASRERITGDRLNFNQWSYP